MANKKDKPFVICYTEHAIRYIAVDAKTKKQAREKFENRKDIDWAESWDYGDFDPETFNEVMIFDKKGNLVKA